MRCNACGTSYTGSTIALEQLDRVQFPASRQIVNRNNGALSSAVEQLVYTEWAGGSTPSARTSKRPWRKIRNSACRNSRTALPQGSVRCRREFWCNGYFLLRRLSASKSPAILPSILLNPKSITTAPSFKLSALNKFAWPVPLITMSASLNFPATSFTCASSTTSSAILFCNQKPTGLPIKNPAPTMTAFRSRKLRCSSFNISSTVPTDGGAIFPRSV